MDVRLEHLTKSFGGDIIAVNDVSLHIEDGEFVVFLGPSGCGKTTTLRMIAGLEKPDSGAIYIGDRLVNDLPPKDRNLAMVFQNFALYGTMDVFENIAFPLRVRKLPDSTVRIMVENVAKLVNVDHLLTRRPNEVSGGEAQRAALARALIREPDVFLMDEPLSSLDAKLRMQMRIELQTLHDKVGTTTVYVTHDQEEAMSLADRIMIMDKGEVQQVGTPRDVYLAPSNVFVASFVGSPPMNIFTGETRDHNGKLVIEFPDFSYELVTDIAQMLKQQGATKVVVGIRPDTFKVARSRDQHNGIEGTVLVTEFLGTRQLASVRLGKQTIVTMVLDSTIRLKAGDTYPFTVDENWLYLFDAASGIALAESNKRRLDFGIDEVTLVTSSAQPEN